MVLKLNIVRGGHPEDPTRIPHIHTSQVPASYYTSIPSAFKGAGLLQECHVADQHFVGRFSASSLSFLLTPQQIQRTCTNGYVALSVHVGPMSARKYCTYLRYV